MVSQIHVYHAELQFNKANTSDTEASFSDGSDFRLYDGSLQLNIFTDRSKGVLLLWIICNIYVLCFSCFRIGSLLPVVTCRERADLLALVYDV